MPIPQPPRKSILRRRQSLSADIEAFLSGLSIVVLFYSLAIHVLGSFRLLDLLTLLTLLAAMTITYDGFGVYRRHSGFASKIFNLLRAWSLSIAGVLVCAYFLGLLDIFYSRSAVGTFFVVGFLLQVAIHLSFKNLQRRFFSSTSKDAAIIVGDGWLAEYMYRKVNTNPWIPETILGAISEASTDIGTANDITQNLPVLGTMDDIDGILDALDIKTVYVVTALDASSVMRKLYFKLLDRSINIHWVPDIFALSLINPNVKELAGIPIITLSESPLSGRALLIKNVEDKVLATLGLLLSSPVMILAAIAIKLGSPGPVFFFQQRTGWDGKVFRIWKFRSMYLHEPEEDLVKQATLGDPRVSRVGRFLRRSSIDELPQLFNVLLGDMSLVGPRPHATQHNDLYSRKIDAYLARHRIKPGITGLAQVAGFRGETKELHLMEERVKRDIEYINNWSLTLDLSILVRTLFIMFGARAY